MITGGSSGLGMDFADQLAKRGVNVILVARRKERLKEIADRLEKNYGIKVRIIAMDLVPDNAPAELYRKVDQMDRQVDILINNAGFGLYGEFLALSWEDELDMLKLDIITVTHLTKLFARDMVKRDYGYILQLSSIGAYQPSPAYASYSAAKSYVLYFGEALAYELRKSNVSCTVLSPGVAKTEFHEVAGQQYTLYQKLVMMKSEKVAKIGIEAMLKEKRSVIPGLLNKLSIWSMKLLPNRWKAALANFTMTMG